MQHHATTTPCALAVCGVASTLQPGAGIDGCRGGWCCALLDASGTLRLLVRPSLAQALEAAPQGLVLLDMPLGLPHPGEPVRRCDVAARKLLGPRRSSVFPPPCREALHARDHAEASHINRRVLGKGCTVQAFHIATKIREADSLLRANRELRHRLLEAHPELAFAAIAARPAAHAKRLAAGRLERLELLEKVLPGCGGLVQEGGKALQGLAAMDDMLDALVLAWSAGQGSENLTQVPAQTPLDAAGLPMRIVLPSRGGP